MSNQSSPEAMDRMIANITKYINLQEQLANSLKNDYKAIGEEWNDKQYENLGDVVYDALVAIQGNYATLSECNIKLILLKSMLEQYLSTRIR